ncbi:MAG: hypothetical protein RBG13Loki_2392 [Promethearchaeota archaeon CR_4]|nr:MAG: hypothetical protein RBG13Loki_2392 [Candidatus Lokiarchaeota archaeon CR_4]
MASDHIISKEKVPSFPRFAKKVVCFANRDQELMRNIKNQLEFQYRVDCITYFLEKSFPESLLATKIWNQDAAIILPKLTTDHQRNPRIYTAIEAAGVPTINSVFSIRLCENRKLTFMYLHKNLPFVKIPEFYISLKDAKHALRRGKKIIVKRNSHHVSHNLRCLGIAEDIRDLTRIADTVPKDEMFLQNYLGPCMNTIYKVYFIGTAVMALKCVKEDVFAERNITDFQERYQPPLSLLQGFRQIGQHLKMNVFGLDYLIGPDGLMYLIDVNDFPSFRGIEEAVHLLCEFIFEHYFMI